MTSRMRKPGEFCWMNMLTPQPAKAREFFAELLGWTFSEIPGVGHIVRVGARDIGGIFDVVSPMTPNGTPPIVGLMVKVESADAAARMVTSLGGKAKPPFDIADQGRMAVCFDPTGAEFDVWEPKKMHGTEVDEGVHGAPYWFELMSSDVESATRFYAELFGWTHVVVPMPRPNAEYTVFQLDSVNVAGMLQITPRMGDVKSHWVTYFTVNSVDEAASKAVELGGSLWRGVQQVPGARFCGISSPQGVEFCVGQSGG